MLTVNSLIHDINEQVYVGHQPHKLQTLGMNLSFKVYHPS